MASIGTQTLDIIDGVVFEPSAVIETLTESGADGHGVRHRAALAPDSPLRAIAFFADGTAYLTALNALLAMKDGTTRTVTLTNGQVHNDCDVLSVFEARPAQSVHVDIGGTYAAKIRAEWTIVVKKRA